MSALSKIDKAVRFLGNKFEELYSRDFFKRVIREMADNRGPDEIPDFANLSRLHGGRAYVIEPDKEFESALIHFDRYKNRPAQAFDTNARSQDPEVRYLNQGRNGALVWKMPEEDLYLSDVMHGCGGHGPCVMQSLWASQEGRADTLDIARDLQRLALGGKEGLIIPYNHTPTPVVERYLKHHGYDVIKDSRLAATISEIGWGGLQKNFDNSIFNAELGNSQGKHLFTLIDGRPVESKRDIGWDLHNDGYFAGINFIAVPPATPRGGIPARFQRHDAKIDKYMSESENMRYPG